MSEPTGLDLAKVRARRDRGVRWMDDGCPPADVDEAKGARATWIVLTRDVPALLDEIDRLKREAASAHAEGIREGRQVASDAILAHADQHAPKDGNEAQRRLRRHLHIAARVALPAITVEEAAEALNAALASLTPDTEEKSHAE